MTTLEIALGGGSLLLVALVVAVARWRVRSRFTYDVVVIGGGAAGLTAAGMAATLGAKTLLVERARLGGDCTWHGCVPSKALVKAARLAHLARQGAAFGLSSVPVEVDLGRVLAAVHERQQAIYEEADSPEVIETFGTEVRQGDARFVSDHELAITTDGATSRVTFHYAIVATGTRPSVPSVPGLDEVPFLTNETLFDLERLPKHLAVLGGGPIGIEMAQAFARLGARVTVIERGEEILPKDEAELAAVVRERMQVEGVLFRLGTEVSDVAREGQGVRLQLRARDGADEREESLAADQLLVATGRVPCVEGLGLAAAGVGVDARGVVVDAHCRTRRAHIYACGDVTGRYQFTHYAEHMAKIAITHALLGLPSRLDDTAVPWVTFTDPELAHVGARREDLERSGRRFATYRFPFAKIDRAAIERVPNGWVYVYATPHRGRILGASVVGEHAGEMVAELGLALRWGISLRQLADTLHAYPTFALGNRRAADQWYVQRTSPLFVRALRWVRGLRGRVPPAPDPDRIV